MILTQSHSIQKINFSTVATSYPNYRGILPLQHSRKHGLLSILLSTSISENGFEVPISGTLSTIFLTNDKFGLSIHPHQSNLSSVKQSYSTYSIEIPS